MKRYYVFIMLVVFSISAEAQQVKEHLDVQQVTGEKYLLKHVVNDFGISMVEMHDPYLSDLKYIGTGMRLDTYINRFFTPDNLNLSYIMKLSLLTAVMSNPRRTSAMTYAGINFAWGTLYHYRWSDALHFLGGGDLSIDFASRANLRNQNNPASMDLATNLNAKLGVKYFIPTKKRVMQLQAMMEFPVAGIMFVPSPGLSFYQMFDLGEFSDTFHFSSFHNRQSFSSLISIIIPWKKTTTRVGIRSENLKYKAHNHVYIRKEYSLIIGTSFDMFKFSGRKVKVPDAFISPQY